MHLMSPTSTPWVYGWWFAFSLSLLLWLSTPSQSVTGLIELPSRSASILWQMSRRQEMTVEAKKLYNIIFLGKIPKQKQEAMPLRLSCFVYSTQTRGTIVLTWFPELFSQSVMFLLPSFTFIFTSDTRHHKKRKKGNLVFVEEKVKKEISFSKWRWLNFCTSVSTFIITVLLVLL